MWILYVAAIFGLLWAYGKFCIAIARMLEGREEPEYGHSPTCSGTWRVVYSRQDHLVTCDCGINPMTGRRHV